MADKDYVLFEDSAGNVISNDPRWLAERTLGIQDGVEIPADVQAELEELRAFKAANSPVQPGAVGQSAAPQTAEEDDTDAASTEGDDYDKLDGKALKKLAGDRSVDITGLTKVGQVREALRAADAAAAS